MPKKPRSGRQVPRAVRLCRVLSNNSRRRILLMLGDGALSVGEIAKRVGLSNPNTSIHLGMLYDHDLVDVAVDKNHRFYGLTDLVTVRKSRGSDEVTIRANDGSSLILCSKNAPKEAG